VGRELFCEMTYRGRMRLFVVAILALGITSGAVARGHGSSHSSGGGRVHYGGGHHTSSHGGSYAGGKGSSHRGGHYRNARTENRYGTHK
jgi:hypothetical protein